MTLLTSERNAGLAILTLAFTASILAALPIPANAQTQLGGSVTVNQGRTGLIHAHNVCRRVLNLNNQPIMVPVNGSNEWSVGLSAFLGSQPENIYVTACPPMSVNDPTIRTCRSNWMYPTASCFDYADDSGTPILHWFGSFFKTPRVQTSYQPALAANSPTLQTYADMVIRVPGQIRPSSLSEVVISYRTTLAGNTVAACQDLYTDGVVASGSGVRGGFLRCVYTIPETNLISVYGNAIRDFCVQAGYEPFLIAEDAFDYSAGGSLGRDSTYWGVDCSGGELNPPPF